MNPPVFRSSTNRWFTSKTLSETFSRKPFSFFFFWSNYIFFCFFFTLKVRLLLIAYLFSIAFSLLTFHFDALLFFTPLSTIWSLWRVNYDKQNLTNWKHTESSRRRRCLLLLSLQLLLLLPPLILLLPLLLPLFLHTASILLASVKFTYCNFTDTVWPVPATPSKYTTTQPPFERVTPLLG